MNNDEVLKLILSKLDSLEQGQESMNHRLDSLEDEQKAMNRRLDTLDEGQKAIRRDVATVNKKLDRLSSDVGLTLAGVTDLVGEEIKMLKAR